MKSTFADLFTTYKNLDPPPIQRQKEDTELINFPNFEEDMIIDNSYSEPIEWDDQINPPFMFQQEQEFIPKETNSINQNLVDTARQFIGGKYLWGGKSPKTGFDCSGFISYIYKQNGIDIPSSTAGLFKTGKSVSLNDAQVGDIICTPGSGRTGRHVKMISRIDNGQIYTIEAKSTKDGIVELPLTKVNNIISIRRILGNAIQNGSKTFSGKKDFTQILSNTYKQVLIERGLDPNYAYILTAQDALESGWGKHQAGKFNFGGIKGGNATPKQTFEYVNGQKKSTTSSFRNFSSLKDYCDYKVTTMANKRYNIFNRTSASNPLQVIATINNAGYSTTPTAQYSRSIMNAYNQVMNYAT